MVNAAGTYYLPVLSRVIPWFASRYLQVVHLYGWQAIISDGSRKAPPHSSSMFSGALHPSSSR
jgi:hypothetical protein